MRRSTGLIKLVAGHVESRKADVETGWIGSDDHGDDADEEQPEDTADGDEQAGSDEDVETDDSEELDDDESEEDDEPAPAPTGKRKRLDKPTGSPTRPNKKVSFAADSKESKRARAAGSTKTPTSTAPKPRPVSKPKTSRAANVNASKTSQKTTSSKGGEEVYDFGKFF
jgi:nuclear GTP-binding protein